MNPLRHIFFAPFYAIDFIYENSFLITWPYRLLAVVVLTFLFLLTTLTEDGPFRVAVIARRFSWLGVVLIGFIVWWIWCAVYFMRHPNANSWAVINSGLVYLTGLALTWFMAVVVMRNHLDKRLPIRAYRRVRLRLRWESISKSVGMSHERDVRPRDWWKGGTLIVRQNARSVQWCPVLWHGRRGADDTTQYLVRPARGLSDKHWTEPRDGSTAVDIQRAIAVAINAKACNLSPKKGSNWWRLTVFWSSPSDYRPELDWTE